MLTVVEVVISAGRAYKTQWRRRTDALVLANKPSQRNAGNVSIVWQESSVGLCLMTFDFLYQYSACQHVCAACHPISLFNL